MALLEKLNGLVWGIPTIVLILGVGVFYTALTRGLQFRKFPEAMRVFWNKLRGAEDNGISSYRALCTALAATVGTGNLAGVAGAIAIGGPGAVFWIWICGLLGMIIKFAEATLAVHYRVKLIDGEYAGGPMYIISRGLPRGKALAFVYCFFGAVASFGVGNATQINTVIQSVHSTANAMGHPLPAWFNAAAGVIMSLLIMYLFLGGAGRIGRIAEILVPMAAVVYVTMCICALGPCIDKIPGVLRQIFLGAFSPRAATGGAVGSFFITLRIGLSRGVFTNEAGMGTAGIAHASAAVQDPWEQGYMGIMEVFLDTIVICTMTALVILSAPISIPFGKDTGILLTFKAFEAVFGSWVQIPLTIFSCLFAFATVLGWGLYGLRCVQFLFGEVSLNWFVLFQGIAVFVSSLMACETVWLVAEIVNGCMAIPNLLALLALRNKLVAITKKIPGKPKRRFAGQKTI